MRSHSPASLVEGGGGKGAGGVLGFCRKGVKKVVGYVSFAA